MADGTLSVDNQERESFGALNIKGGATLIAIDPNRFGKRPFAATARTACESIKVDNPSLEVLGPCRMLSKIGKALFPVLQSRQGVRKSAYAQSKPSCGSKLETTSRLLTGLRVPSEDALSVIALSKQLRKLSRRRWEVSLATQVPGIAETPILPIGGF